MKYSDDLYDVNHDIKLASVFGILCAIASAVATVGDVGAAYIFIAILYPLAIPNSCQAPIHFPHL